MSDDIKDYTFTDGDIEWVNYHKSSISIYIDNEVSKLIIHKDDVIAMAKYFGLLQEETGT